MVDLITLILEHSFPKSKDLPTREGKSKCMLGTFVCFMAPDMQARQPGRCQGAKSNAWNDLEHESILVSLSSTPTPPYWIVNKE